MMTKLTVKQLRDLGILERVMDYLKINPYALNEGLLNNESILEFDSELNVKNPPLNKARIVLVLKDCSDCPYITCVRDYSDSDGWDEVSDYKCSKNNEYLGRYHNIRGIIEIPEWCPYKMKNTDLQSQ